MAIRGRGGGWRALELFRPVAALLPAVRRAERKVPFRERVMYTGMSLSVFLACSHLPLYGIRYAATAAAGADPLHWLRSILASNRGTLMELGVVPRPSSRAGR
uniref:Translocon Sec61/SecY plug domain-containing protein n=1 Tax=Oryza meridionalis TaxID=40149 RepID=A0A0E0ETR5_9ORYZ